MLDQVSPLVANDDDSRVMNIHTTLMLFWTLLSLTLCFRHFGIFTPIIFFVTVVLTLVLIAQDSFGRRTCNKPLKVGIETREKEDVFDRPVSDREDEP